MPEGLFVLLEGYDDLGRVYVGIANIKHVASEHRLGFYDDKFAVTVIDKPFPGYGNTDPGIADVRLVGSMPSNAQKLGPERIKGYRKEGVKRTV